MSCRAALGGVVGGGGRNFLLRGARGLGPGPRPWALFALQGGRLRRCDCCDPAMEERLVPNRPELFFAWKIIVVGVRPRSTQTCAYDCTRCSGRCVIGVRLAVLGLRFWLWFLGGTRGGHQRVLTSAAVSAVRCPNWHRGVWQSKPCPQWGWPIAIARSVAGMPYSGFAIPWHLSQRACFAIQDSLVL